VGLLSLQISAYRFTKNSEMAEESRWSCINAENKGSANVCARAIINLLDQRLRKL
jgi:hypothetical protein